MLIAKYMQKAIKMSMIQQRAEPRALTGKALVGRGCGWGLSKALGVQLPLARDERVEQADAQVAAVCVLQLFELAKGGM